MLGNGKTGEHIAASRVLFEEQYDPLLVEGAIKGKKIVQITSGQQHNLALDDEGYVYAWGYGGEFLEILTSFLPSLVRLLTPTEIPGRIGSIGFGSSNGCVDSCSTTCVRWSKRSHEVPQDRVGRNEQLVHRQSRYGLALWKMENFRRWFEWSSTKLSLKRRARNNADFLSSS